MHGVAGPAHRYYAACEGRWRAPLSVTITDAAALERSGMSLLDRWSLQILSRWPSWLGSVWFDTSVERTASGEVLHTTIVRWLGVPLQASEETFTIAEDGAHFSIRGGLTGAGVVADDATRADYTLAWRGITITQFTYREPDRVTVHQTGPGFSMVQRLVRRA